MHKSQLTKAVLFALAMLGGTACAAAPATYAGTVCGFDVVYHPDDIATCDAGAAACTQGSPGSGFNIYYSTRDMTVLGHEREHVCGMRHRKEWVSVGGKNCTVVTEGGKTEWKRGDIMCRVDEGAPIKMNDPALVSFFKE